MKKMKSHLSMLHRKRNPPKFPFFVSFLKSSSILCYPKSLNLIRHAMPVPNEKEKEKIKKMVTLLFASLHSAKIWKRKWERNIEEGREDPKLLHGVHVLSFAPPASPLTLSSHNGLLVDRPQLKQTRKPIQSWTGPYVSRASRSVPASPPYTQI